MALSIPGITLPGGEGGLSTTSPAPSQSTGGTGGGTTTSPTSSGSASPSSSSTALPSTTTRTSSDTSTSTQTQTPSVVVSTSVIVSTISGTPVTSTLASSATVLPDSSGSSSGLSTGAKVGIIVGSSVGGGLLILGLLFYLCTGPLRRRRNAYTPGEDEIRWPVAEQEADTLFPAAVRPTGGSGFIDRNPSMRTATDAGGATSTYSSQQHGGTMESYGVPNGYSQYGSSDAPPVANGTYEGTGTYESMPYSQAGAAAPAGGYGQATGYPPYDHGAGAPAAGLGPHAYERAYSPTERQVGGQISSQGHEALANPYEDYPSDYAGGEAANGAHLGRGASVVSRPGPLHLVNAGDR